MAERGADGDDHAFEHTDPDHSGDRNQRQHEFVAVDAGERAEGRDIDQVDRRRNPGIAARARRWAARRSARLRNIATSPTIKAAELTPTMAERSRR